MRQADSNTRRLDETIDAIQVSFPQIYLACHTRHQRKRSTPHRLSARDSSILAHLDEREPVTPARLAGHLNIAASTLSEALKRLTALGFVAPTPAEGGSRRRNIVLLTKRGADAIRDTSVLETARLSAALEGASARELLAISSGMRTLANACNRYALEARTRRATPR
jgi:DNA-binding MarR family transcriptional regulator